MEPSRHEAELEMREAKPASPLTEAVAVEVVVVAVVAGAGRAGDSSAGDFPFCDEPICATAKDDSK